MSSFKSLLRQFFSENLSGFIFLFVMATLAGVMVFFLINFINLPESTTVPSSQGNPAEKKLIYKIDSVQIDSTNIKSCK